MKPFAIAIILGLCCVLIGCEVEDVRDFETVDYGGKAAASARAKLLKLNERIKTFQRQRDDALAKREAVLKEATKTRQKAAETLRDTAMTPAERESAYNQYKLLAQDQENEADKYKEVAADNDSTISQLDQERHDLQHQIEVLENMRGPAPE